MGRSCLVHISGCLVHKIDVRRFIWYIVWVMTARPDDVYYKTVYLGKGDEGARISGTLRAAAQAAGQSLSEFLVRAGLERARSSRYVPDKNPHVPDKTRYVPDNGPESTPGMVTATRVRVVRARPDDTTPIATATRVRRVSARPSDLDGPDAIPFPTIDGDPPNPKPSDET